ncbi:MAG: molecular chaperone DnaJ [Actinomycetota bacterium]
MMSAVDLYDLLGVARDASADDIKRAYRALARELHPDASGDPATEERFKEVTAAYEILSDPEKRARYDRGGVGGIAGQPFGDVADLFEAFFGPGAFGGRRTAQRRTRTQRGEDLFARVELSFDEAAFGAHRLRVERLVACAACAGTGAAAGTAPTRCPGCGGGGQVQDVRQSIFGTVMTATPCRRCEGTGEEILDRCASCRGRGREAAFADVPVDIPAGVADGLEVRLPGAGHAGRAGGTSGDLYVSLAVEPHPVYARRGQDLFATLDVPFTTAALGGDVDVATLDGTERLGIPAGTQPGDVLRMKGHGVPNLGRRGRGDLFLTVEVAVPRKVGRDERELLERLAEVRGDGPPVVRRMEGR